MDILALTWAGIIAFGVVMYVTLGGFDIGIGILSIFIRDPNQRDIMVSTILPVWDGNQTWLVFGGAALYGAFPVAFSTILPILYMPILMMVISLLFRGIAFEFMLKATKTKPVWNSCFFLGSLFATIAQGLVLGTFVQGFTLDANVSVHFTYQWLNPFALMCAVGLVCGYLLLAADYLIRKTVGELQKKAFALSSKLQYLILLGCIVASIWSPFLDPSIQQRWFDTGNMFYLSIFPLFTLLFFAIHWRAIKYKREKLPFWCAIGMFIMCYIGFIISIYPYIVPRKITYMEAAANHSSLLFMLIGACVMLPVLLYYTYYSYRIFRGKVTEKIQY